MGLFDFRKKHREKASENVTSQEPAVQDTSGEEAASDVPKDRWSQAYQAMPQAYQNAGGAPFLVFTLTEDTDTILPLDPRQMYPVNGKEVRDIRLGLVSITKEQVIGDFPYYLCTGFLADKIVESRPPFVLIGAMSLEEMQELVQKSEEEIAAREEMQQIFAENLDFLSKDEIAKETVSIAFASENVETYTFENVPFPTGHVVVADPISYLQDPDTTGILRETIPVGNYPVMISVLHTGEDLTRIVGMKLKVQPKEAVSYELAKDYRMIDEKEEKGYGGYAVEAGMATICDLRAAEGYWDFLDDWYEDNPDGNLYDDYLADMFADSYEALPSLQRENGDFIRFSIPDGEDEIVMAASGFGDGFYSAFWGKDENGEIAELVTVFIDPALYERL